MTILDGAMGTELESRGVDTSGPAWTARAVIERPQVVQEIHAAYARAGAEVITACTFRSTRRGLASWAGRMPAPAWDDVARRAVALAREGAGEHAKVAGSIAPLDDCWHPERSPAIEDPGGARRDHAALAAVLADAGCDILLCETFAHVGEGLIALEAAVATGIESWLSFTPGYRGDLQAVDAIAEGAQRAADAGAAGVLVNCVPVEMTDRIVEAMSKTVHDQARIGAYANGKDMHDQPVPPDAYREHAARWITSGAAIIGGCCHTTPAHIAAIA